MSIAFNYSILFYSILYILWYSHVSNVLSSCSWFLAQLNPDLHTRQRDIHCSSFLPCCIRMLLCLPETEGWILSLSPTLSQLMPCIFSFLYLMITIFASFHLSALFICPFFSSLYPLYVFSIHQFTNNRDSDSELELGERKVIDTTSFVWNWRKIHMAMLLSNWRTRKDSN